MTNLFDKVKLIIANIETAAEQDEENLEYYQDVIEGVINYYEGVITRANTILDKNRNKVFNDILNISTRGEMERAVQSYTKSFLLNLNLSLETTSELAQTLIHICKNYKVDPPKDWIDVAKFDTNVGRIKTKLKYVREVAEM